MDQEEEIKKLHQKVDALQKALTDALIQGQTTAQLALALAATHQNPEAALRTFNALIEASEGPLIYSTLTDEDMGQIEQLRSAVRATLRPGSP